MVKNKIVPFIVLIVFFEAVILTKSVFFNNPVSDIKTYADQVIALCKSANYRPSCYDREIPKLMDKISMEEAFKVTRIVQKEDENYLYCHVLGHKLSGIETRKDPSRWKEVITRCPQTICNNGCLHGPLLEIFNSESLTDDQIQRIVPEVKTICEPRDNWNPLEVERSMCYHAIGHLNMYITRADINKSLDLCNKVAVKEDGRSYLQTCTQGVFMQIFQPLEPEDFALVKNITPEKSEVSKFCDSYDEPFAKGACHRESWPLSREEILMPEGAIEFCSYSDDYLEKRRCFSALMSIVTVHFAIEKQNLQALYDYCNSLPEKHNSFCFGDAAKRMIQIDPSYADRAIEICDLAKQADFKDRCFKELINFSKRALKRDSLESRKLCENAPENLKNTCQ